MDDSALLEAFASIVAEAAAEAEAAAADAVRQFEQAKQAIYRELYGLPDPTTPASPEPPATTAT